MPQHTTKCQTLPDYSIYVHLSFISIYSFLYILLSLPPFKENLYDTYGTETLKSIVRGTLADFNQINKSMPHKKIIHCALLN